MAMFKEHLHLPVTCIDASKQTLGLLAGVSDPEKKRKIIGAGALAILTPAPTTTGNAPLATPSHHDGPRESRNVLGRGSVEGDLEGIQDAGNQGAL